jgi:hypothetical protein
MGICRYFCKPSIDKQETQLALFYVIAVFTEALLGNAAEMCLPQCCVASSGTRLGTARNGEKTAFLIVA